MVHLPWGMQGQAKSMSSATMYITSKGTQSQDTHLAARVHSCGLGAVPRQEANESQPR